MVKVKDGRNNHDQALAEAENMAQLRHQNVIEFYEVFEDEVHFYFVMELMQISLIDLMIIRGGRLSEKEAAEVTLEIARGIEYIHSRE